MTPLQTHLQTIYACREARKWAGDRTAQQAWDECERADWLLWWAATQNIDRKLLVRTACQCARHVLRSRFVPQDELRPLHAIETAERWCDGLATIAEVRFAAADAVDTAMSRSDAVYAAYVAAYAAYAAVDTDFVWRSATVGNTPDDAPAQEHPEMSVIVRTAIPFGLLQIPEGAA